MAEDRLATLLLATLLCLCLLSDLQAVRAADLTENIGQGRVNWTQGLVTASGMGAPPKEVKNLAQARAMAQRAAITVARRNLLEVLKGVRIDSTTTVENFIVSSDQIRTQVSGILQGSQVMQTRYFSDGSIEVTVGIRLTGELASILIPPLLTSPVHSPPAIASEPKPMAVSVVPSGQKGSVSGPAEGAREKEMAAPTVEAKPVSAAEGRIATTKPAGEIASRQPGSADAPSASEVKAGLQSKLAPSGPGEPSAELPPPPFTGEGQEDRASTVSKEAVAKASSAPAPPPLIATGLVVDARGLGVKPALLPRILDEQGGEIYSVRQVRREIAVEQGLVGYAKDVSAAQRNIRVTDRPLLVKGIRASGKEKTDVVIPDSDASTIVAAERVSNFLEKSRVIIVYD